MAFLCLLFTSSPDTSPGDVRTWFKFTVLAIRIQKTGYQFRCCRRYFHSLIFFSRLQEMTHSKNSHLLMDTVPTVRYVKSGKFWRVSDSIFKSPHLFFWDVSAIMTWSRGASDNKNSDHQKNFWTFFLIMHFCPGRYERQGRTKSGCYPELPRIWARMPE